MIRQVGNVTFEAHLRELGLVSLQTSRERGDWRAAFSYLTGGSRGWSEAVLSSAGWQIEAQWSQVAVGGSRWEIRKNCFPRRGVKPWGSGGISIPRGF